MPVDQFLMVLGQPPDLSLKTCLDQPQIGADRLIDTLERGVPATGRRRSAEGDGERSQI